MDHHCSVSSEAPVQPTGGSNKRLRQTLRDMALSMAVVLVVVFFIWLLAWRPNPDPIKVIDAAPVVALAAASADFPVQAPAGLALEWRATSARWEPTDASGAVPVLHVGYVTPTDKYAQVSESTVESAVYLKEQTSGGLPLGTVLAVSGQQWDQWEGDKRRSLVRVQNGIVTVVSGTAGWDELSALAASLVPAVAAPSPARPSTLS
jgi:hypothetical protein